MSLVAGLALLLDGLALADFVLHPLAQDHNFHSALYRAATILVLVPLTLLVGYLIIRRVPGNVVGPLFIVWSGTVAYNSTSLELGPTVYALYFAYNLVFGWLALFLMLLHFPDGKIHPPGASRWIYLLSGLSDLVAVLIFFSYEPLDVISSMPNVFMLPVLLPYAGLILGIALLIGMPILVWIPVSFVLRYRKSSLLERQQIKWLALFGGFVCIYTSIFLIAYPLLIGSPPITPGTDLQGMFFFFISGLFPPLAIGISILRYRLWDIDRIIRRTLVYSILTVTLTLIYLGSVVVLQAVFALFFKLGNNDLAIVFSNSCYRSLIYNTAQSDPAYDRPAFLSAKVQH